MRYVQLRAFHNVAIHGGFSRAADKLGLTQPAISDQVRKLELDYDILLFNRSNKKAVLTEFGHQLLNITNQMFEFEQQARDLLMESRTSRQGRLRIIADSPHHLLHILARFQDQYPNVKLSLKTGNSDEVLGNLYAYKADIGVLGAVPDNNSLNCIKLNSTAIVAFVARGFSAKYKHPTTIEEIVKHPLVLREPGSRTRGILEEFSKSRGAAINPAIEVEGRDAVREVVASGAGIGFVSLAEFGHDTRLEKLPFHDPELIMDEALVCLRERSNGRLIKAFMAMAGDGQ